MLISCSTADALMADNYPFSRESHNFRIDQGYAKRDQSPQVISGWMLGYVYT